MSEYSFFYEFQKKFQLDLLTIKTIGNWNISLRPKQTTLGALIVSLNRPCLSMAELSKNDLLNLEFIYQEIEYCLKKFCDFEKINYLTLMMVDSQLHFHVIPRYSKPRFFENEIYIDTGWPALPDLTPKNLNIKQTLSLKNTLAEYFSKYNGRGE